MVRKGFQVQAGPLREIAPRRPWSAQRWRAYFLRQQNTLLAIPWERGSQLTPEERALVAPSLREFQQGEGLEGGHFFACVAAYGKEEGDMDYVEAHRLFMAEEKRHARDLARFLGLAGIPLLERRSRWNEAFCWLGSRAGLETTLAIILMVEVIAQTYYTVLRGATRSTVLSRLCDQILRDEKTHVRFQAERLAILRRQRSRWGLFLNSCLDLFLFMGAGLACWLGHHRLLRASGFGFSRPGGKKILVIMGGLESPGSSMDRLPWFLVARPPRASWFSSHGGAVNFLTSRCFGPAALPTN